ncbi:MAG TPA: acetamidase/formamidase family protein [Spirochaetia bacterium]|nr:acetamidase/formamidase family protein [Spirochaetia bacterium]
MARVIVPRECKFFEFNPANQFPYACRSGDTLVFETTEAPDGQIRSEEDYNRPLDPRRANPTTGPVACTGSLPGDVLAVRIEKITVRGPGYIAASPRVGLLNEAVLQRTGKILSLKGNSVLFEGRPIAVRPMIGVIGTTPRQPAKTNECGPFGGNMDNRKITEGSTVYLPVFLEGAGLGIGDLHAGMGDGEVCGAGIEVAGTVETTVRLIRNASFGFPMVATETEWMVCGEGVSLIEAVRVGCERVFELLTGVFAMERGDAYLFMSAFCHVEVCECAFSEGTVPVPGPGQEPARQDPIRQEPVRLPAAVRIVIPKETGLDKVFD